MSKNDRKWYTVLLYIVSRARYTNFPSHLTIELVSSFCIIHVINRSQKTLSWQYIQFIHVWAIITLYNQQSMDDHLRLDNMHFHRHSFQRKNYFEVLHRYRDKVCVQKLFGHAISLFITIRSKFTKWKQTLIVCKTCWRT